jgi:hypothetical protein
MPKNTRVRTAKLQLPKPERVPMKNRNGSTGNGSRRGFSDLPAIVRQEVHAAFTDADAWLDAPNTCFGGRPPRELIGTDQEHLLEEWAAAVRYGIYS